MKYQAHVITVSDRAAREVYADRSGPVLRDGLAELGFDVRGPKVVADSIEQIASAIREAISAGARLVVTTGGTGLGPRDVTVEATNPLVTREVPGLMQEVRRVGALKVPEALLSRGIAGEVQLPGLPPAFVINAPGSRGGVRDTLSVVGPVLRHIIDQLDGGDHPYDPNES